jgi:trigger factor
MKSQVTNTTKSDTTITITLDHDHLKPYVAKAYDHLRARVKAAGFRPGKAPDHIVERELGAAAVQSEVMEHAIEESYAAAVGEHDIAAIAPPDVKVTKYVPYDELEYTATVDTMPDVVLGDYKKIKLEQPEVAVEDTEIEATIDDLRKRLATKQPVERPAGLGDEVNIDFSGTKDGLQVEGATATGHELVLGSNTFIPGFEDQLVGLAQGAEKTFDIKFPDDYSATDLAGQKVTFAVKVNGVNELVLPEVDEKFVATISPLKSVEELRADIKERIEAEKKEAASAKYEQDVLDQIVEKSDWEAPKRMVASQLNRMKEEMGERLASSGLTLEKYLTLSSKTMEDLEQELEPAARKRVGLALVLNKIAREEQVTVSNDDVDAELARLKSQYTDPSVQADLNAPSVREDILNHLVASKTVEKILSYVKED